MFKLIHAFDFGVLLQSQVLAPGSLTFGRLEHESKWRPVGHKSKCPRGKIKSFPM